MLYRVALLSSWLLDTLSENETMYLKLVAERDLIGCHKKSDMASVLQCLIDLIDGRNWSEEEEVVLAVKKHLDCD